MANLDRLFDITIKQGILDKSKLEAKVDTKIHWFLCLHLKQLTDHL